MDLRGSLSVIIGHVGDCKSEIRVSVASHHTAGSVVTINWIRQVIQLKVQQKGYFAGSEPLACRFQLSY